MLKRAACRENVCYFEVQLHAFLILALDGKWLASRFDRLIPVERSRITLRIGGCVAPERSGRCRGKTNAFPLQRI
jgi:hypothetical protein